MSLKALFETLEYGPAPESASRAKDWIREHDASFKLFIGGRWQQAKNAASLEVIDPAAGRALARVARAGAEEVELAVAAARAAFPAWSSLPGHARARHLYALARAVQRQSRLLSVLESLNNGKPIRESRDVDIPLV